MKVKLTKSQNTLSIGNTYRVIGIESDSYRILSDVGEPYLYASDSFEIIEKGGEDWNTKYYEGKEYSYPSEFSDYFFEDYFETYDLKKRTMIRRYLEKLIQKEESLYGYTA
jgi:hypothetical protein